MLSLAAIVVPARAAELDAIKRNLTLWSAPEFAPSVGTSTDRPVLHFVFNNQDARKREDEILRLFTDRAMDRHFRGLKFTYLDLFGLDDLYSRTGTGPVGPGGYKAGPNNQFFQSMELYRDSAGAIFFMETDCVPVRAGWIEALRDVLLHHQQAFVIGSTYRGKGRLDRKIFRHVNGNAIYCAGHAGFFEFLAQWNDWLTKLISAGRVNLAYDVLIESVFAMAPVNDEAHEFFTRYVGRLQYSNVLRDISAPPDASLTDANIVQHVLSHSSDTYFLHGAVFARAVEDLFASGNPLHPENLLIRSEASPFRFGRRRSILGKTKARIVDQLRDFADWLDQNEVKRLLLPRFPGRRHKP